MNTIKQIVYTEQYNKTFVIEANEDTCPVIPRPIDEMTGEGQKEAFEALRTYCLTLIEGELKFVIYTADINRLDIQPMEGEPVYKIVSEMAVEEKVIVDSVGLVCTQLINA